MPFLALPHEAKPYNVLEMLFFHIIAQTVSVHFTVNETILFNGKSFRVKKKDENSIKIRVELTEIWSVENLK